MKIFLLTLFLHTCSPSNAQIHHAMPPEASVFYHQAMECSNEKIIRFVDKKSMQLATSNINADSLLAALKKEAELKKLSPESLKTLSLLILIRCYHQTDKEIKSIVLKLQKQDTEERNFDRMAPLIERKSMIAKFVSEGLGQIEDYTILIRNLM